MIFTVLYSTKKYKCVRTVFWKLMLVNIMALCIHYIALKCIMETFWRIKFYRLYVGFRACIYFIGNTHQNTIYTKTPKC